MNKKERKPISIYQDLDKRGRARRLEAKIKPTKNLEKKKVRKDMRHIVIYLDRLKERLNVK